MSDNEEEDGDEYVEDHSHTHHHYSNDLGGGLAGVAFFLFLAIVSALFAGTPDLMDAIIHKMTNGQSQLPPPEKE